MPNPFEEFGGIADSDLYKEEPSKANVVSNENSDPFAEFGGFSDASIKGTAQSKVSTPESNIIPISNSPVVHVPDIQEQEPQVPIKPINGVITGGTSTNSYLDSKGKLHFEGEENNKINAINKFKHGAKAISTNFDEWLNRSNYDKEVQKQKMDIALALETLPFTFGKAATWGASQLSKLPIVNNIAKPIISNGAKLISKLPKPLRSIPALSAEGGAWGAFDHGAHKLAGFDNENTLGQDIAIGAAAMPMLAGGIYGGAKIAKTISKTKPVKAIKDKYNALLNSDTSVGNTIANVQGTLADTLGLDAVNETARKYQKLNRNISKGNTPVTKKFSKNDLDEIDNAEKLSKEQQDIIFDRLKNGEPKKSTITKEQNEAKEFFDNLLEKENGLQHAGDDLSNVKSDLDINTLKNDLTHVKDDSSMPDEKYKVKLPEEKIDENNYFKKMQKELQREKWNRQLERIKENKEVNNEVSPKIKRLTYGGRVHVTKDGESWIAYSKKKKLQSGNAEGSDSGNWYVHEANSKPKQLGADDMYETSIDEIKPTTDEELMKEIAEAKKGKQLPSVNKPANIVPKTPAQRIADRLENEKAQMSWKKKLRTKVKSLNSDADSDAKTIGELIFGSNNKFYDYANNAEVNRVYTGKVHTCKVKDLTRNEYLPRWINKFFGDTNVHIVDSKSNKNGYFDYNTNSITIYSSSKNMGKTLIHEIRHAIQNQIKNKTWFGSRARKLTESCKRRTKELSFYVDSKERMSVVNKVEQFANKLKNGIITQEEFVNNVTYEEAKTYQSYIKAHSRYKSAYLERDARSFADGNYDRKLFGQTVEQFKGKLRHNESKYPRTVKGRRNFMEYGESNGISGTGISKDISEWRRNPRIYEDGLIKSIQSGEQRLASTPQSYIKSIRNSSKAQEQTKIEFDIITEGQASNRLKQQSDGEGVYFKQGFKKSNDTIDLTKDYNEGRNKKVGHFGEKTFEGLGKRGTTKDILIETKKEEIKVQHMKDSINFVESEFAKPIPASGEIKDGYVAINRNLLANAIYGNKSTAWYETMAKGEDAIRKSFKNEKVANNWIELASRNSKPDYQLPKQVFDKLFDGSGETVAEYWERYGKDHTGKAMLKTTGAILDAFNNSFKRGVLTSSSFVLNNRFGNQMMIAAKSNPVEYIKSFYNASKLKNKDLPVEIIESSLLEAVEGYQARQTYTGWLPLDNFLNLCSGHTIDTSTLKTMKAAPDNGLHFKVIRGETVPAKTIEKHNAKSVLAETANMCIGLPNKAFNKICDNLMKFNESMERFERKQVYGIQMDKVRKDMVKKTGQRMLSQEEFLTHIKDHPELEETIIKGIEDTLGDYNNFNKFEKKVLKRVVPFYSWYRTITRHTITLAKDNPTRCGMIFLELQRLQDKDQDLKEWQRGALRTGIYDSRSNKELLVNKTAQVPYSTFKEFIDESGKGGLSPAIKKPIESIRGKQFFNDTEITSKRYKKATKGYGKKAKEGYLDKNTGEFHEGGLPLMPRINYLGKEALETIYPAMRSPLIKPEATVQGLANLITDGEYKEPDKLYDSDLGGYSKGDKFLGKERRYAANDTSTSTKMINRVFGLSLQNKQKLNKEEREAYKEKIKRQRQRMQDK